MDSIPVEILTNIFSFFSNTDLRSLRLVCKSFAGVGEKYLFTDWIFRLRPREQSLKAFEAIANHPRVSKSLGTLICETGVLSDVDEFRVWKAAIIQEQWNVYAREHATPYGGLDQDAAVDFHNRLDASFWSGLEKTFEEYRQYLDVEVIDRATAAQQERLLKAMRIVIPKRRYVVSMSETDISLDELCHFHDHRDSYNLVIPSDSKYTKKERISFRRSACQIHYLQYLCGIAECRFDTSSFKDKELILEGLSAEMLDECFSPNKPDRIVLPEGLSWDHGLMVKAWSLPWSQAALVHVRFRLLPHSDLLARHFFWPLANGTIPRHHARLLDQAQRLEGKPVGDTSQLQRLSISFAPEIGEHLSYNIRPEDPQPTQNMGILSWTSLFSLSLDRFHASINDFESILRYQPGIVHLTLKNGMLISGASLIELVHVLRQKRDLQSVCIEGEWNSMRDCGRWKIFNESNFSEGNMFDGPYPKMGLKHRVEHFILHGGVCPLKSLQEDRAASLAWERLSDESWQYKWGM